MKGFYQSVLSHGHRLKACCQVPNSLVVVAVHLQLMSPIPTLHRTAFDDGHRVAVAVVMGMINVVHRRPFFLLHIPEQRATADHIQ